MKRFSFFCLVALFIPIFFVQAQAPKDKLQHVSLAIEKPTISLHAGETGTVKLTAQFEKSWHFYGLTRNINKDGIGPQATELTVAPKNIITLHGKPRSSKPVVIRDEGFEMDVEIFENQAEFTIPFQANAKLKPGRYEVEAKIYAQMCDTVRCLPGAEEKIPFTLVILDQKDGIKR